MPIVGPARIEEVAVAIRGGAVVAIPTDTVYGLAVLPGAEGALERLAALKGRSADQPFALLFDSLEGLRGAVEEPALVETLASFWPGPLTAVVRARAGFASAVVTPEGTIGLRVPDDELTRAVIRACGGALAVTSANRSGQPPAEHAREVSAVFGDDLLVLDGGPRTGRPPSTVVDLTSQPPTVLRNGPIDGAKVLAALAGP